MYSPSTLSSRGSMCYRPCQFGTLHNLSNWCDFLLIRFSFVHACKAAYHLNKTMWKYHLLCQGLWKSHYCAFSRLDTRVFAPFQPYLTSSDVELAVLWGNWNSTSKLIFLMFDCALYDQNNLMLPAECNSSKVASLAAYSYWSHWGLFLFQHMTNNLQF